MAQATLTTRQRRLYLHTCDVWRSVITIGANGKPTKSWTRIDTGIKCYFRIKKEVSNPEIQGRIPTDYIDTQDEIHFGQDQDLMDADWLKNTTVGDNKEGIFWVVRGQPRLISNSGVRSAGYLAVQATQQREPPAGVS